MPIVTTIFTVLGQPVDSLDTQATRDKQMLQRSYFQFLQTITMHDVMEVIANQGEYYGMEFSPCVLPRLALETRVLER